MLEKAKLALRITSNAYNDEINDLIAVAKLDLGIAGVDTTVSPDELCQRAILT